MITYRYNVHLFHNSSKISQTNFDLRHFYSEFLTNYKLYKNSVGLPKIDQYLFTILLDHKTMVTINFLKLNKLLLKFSNFK